MAYGVPLYCRLTDLADLNPPVETCRRVHTCRSSVLVFALEHQLIAGFDVGCGPGREFDD
ncbi:hypothetical protein SAMN05192552_101724 [Natrinema hispanicum]|uniref:Uncharacterized protein n=1 Tax=Natrinema hispanicum TaxID=392421 RepID=A0A1I0C4T3_9EURY|nr:hypothetical protein SAMN05192552_101724 [Natrinema hispanicum]SET14363.1 hypothetical protein SAMN04488694_10427 [Natrinema hispanicum]